MDQPLTGIDVAQVDREIADRFRLLRFASPIETMYDAEESERRCKHYIRQNYIGIGIYHCFIFSDYFVIRDAIQTDLFMHFFVMTPVLFAANYVCSLRPRVWVREGVQSLSLSILALSIVVVASASRFPDRDLVNFTNVLIVSYATIVLRTRFWYAAACCVICQVIFSASLMTMTPFSMDRTIMSNFIFLAVVVFSLVGSYNLEHAQRMGYLLALRDRFRSLDLERASLRDALTGVANRRALDVTLRSLKTQDPVSGLFAGVLLVDIDHFKLFNDTNGHQDGDACLAHVAGAITTSVRDCEGTVFRYGGEEFLVLLEDVTLAMTLAVAERIRSGVATAAISHVQTATGCVTVSIGAAAGRLACDLTPEDLIGAADRALYTAKRSGRNQVWPSPTGEMSASLPTLGSWRAAPG